MPQVRAWGPRCSPHRSPGRAAVGHLQRGAGRRDQGRPRLQEPDLHHRRVPDRHGHRSWPHRRRRAEGRGYGLLPRRVAPPTTAGSSASGHGIGSVLPFPGTFAIVISPNPILVVIVACLLHARVAADHLQLLHRRDPHHGRHVPRPHAAGVAVEDQPALPLAARTPTSSTSLLGASGSLATPHRLVGQADPRRDVRRGYVFVVSCLAAALLPYRAKALYEAAPGSQYRLGGVPLVTIFGAHRLRTRRDRRRSTSLCKPGYGLNGTPPGTSSSPASSSPAWSSTGSAALPEGQGHRRVLCVPRGAARVTGRR